MRDRAQQHLGVYTKHHGFMTLEGFKNFKPAKGEKPPEQVTACEFRRVQRDKQRRELEASALAYED